MIYKTLLISIALSISQLSFAEMDKPNIDLTAANKAHAGMAVTKQEKDQPFWSKDQKQHADLEEKYKQAIAGEPENKKNYAYLAGVYLSGNKTAKAIDAYQDAITKDPANPKLFAAISIAYLHQSRFAMAKSMADEALKLDPSLKQVEKINEYITAKEAAIAAASEIPVIGKAPGLPGNSASLHGSVMPTATAEKPVDKIHTKK